MVDGNGPQEFSIGIRVAGLFESQENGGSADAVGLFLGLFEDVMDRLKRIG